MGEISLSKEEKEEVQESELCKTIFFDDDIELFLLSRLFLQIPFEYGAMGATGKHYQATKDFLEWNGFSVEEWTSVVLQMGNVWISSKSK